MVLSVQIQTCTSIRKIDMMVRNTFFRDILTIEECNSLRDKILEFEKQKSSSPIEQEVIRFGNNKCSIYKPLLQIGIEESFRNNLVQKLTSTINKEYPEKIKFSHSFATIYRNGAHLDLHNDGLNYDITLTVNIGGLENWAIKVSKVLVDEKITVNESLKDKYPYINFEFFRKKENHEEFFIPRGSGIACYARKTPHWREVLNCNDDEYVIQMLFHWTFIR